MRKRTRRKISNRMLDIDEMISAMFRAGGLRVWREEIGNLRMMIQYLRRRWPIVYRQTFYDDLDLGHIGAGR